MSSCECKKVLKNELRFLWFDLANDINFAANGTWSIACETRVQRILWVSKVVGMLDWGSIQLPLLTGGVYNAVREKAGLEPVDFRTAADWEHDYEKTYPPTAKMQETARRISEMIVEDFEEWQRPRSVSPGL